MNISELAAHLNVSPTTVSRVLSGSAEKYRISAVTVARVREAATRFQVAPDLLGSSLRSGKLGMIGLLVPDITNPFFSGLARSIELQLRDHDLTVQLCDSSEDSETELALLKQMLGRRLDGL
ncbi:MAG: LacI family DNA-binding transcriptional regulator [Verrucomicrobiota bacterium]